MNSDKSLGPWLEMELWSLREAAYLLSSVAPRGEIEFKVDMNGKGPVALQYRALKDATIAGSLWHRDADGTFVRRRVRPSEVVAWAKSRAMPIPDELAHVRSAGTQSKLTADQKADIAKRLKKLETVAALAREFGVDRRTIDKCKPQMSAPQSTTWASPLTQTKGKR